MAALEKTLVLDGMHCMHCVANTKQALSKVRGVRKVEVTLEPQEAHLVVAPKVTDEALKEAVESLGFKVLEIK